VAKIVVPLEDRLRLARVRQRGLRAARELLRARELEEQLAGVGRVACGSSFEPRVQHVDRLLEATGDGQRPALLDPERCEVQVAKALGREGVVDDLERLLVAAALALASTRRRSSARTSATSARSSS
jgi:hypothetical protein